MAGVCGPVYNSIQTMLNDDMDNVARLLSELGPLEEQGEEVEIEKDIVSYNQQVYTRDLRNAGF